VPRPPDDRSDSVRAFFAVELPVAARAAAAECLRALAARPGGDRVRWVRPENLHVTLRFLGPITRERLPVLASRVGESVARTQPFTIALGAPGWLGSRVVTLEVAPAEPLERLAAAVERGVVAAGCEPEARPFRAHLTLGRLRRGRRPAVTAAVTAVGDVFPVNEVVLSESRLHPTGARYSALERILLGA